MASPEPSDEAHRLAVADGLLSAVGADTRLARESACEFLGLAEDASQEEIIAGLTDVIEAAHQALAAAGVKPGNIDGEPEEDDASSATGDDIPVQGHDPPGESYLYVPVTLTAHDDTQEATVENGTAVPYGGIDAEAFDQDDKGNVVLTSPPNLRMASGWDACGNCIFWDGVGCTKYGFGREGTSPDMIHRGVFRTNHDQVCDSHETVSPQDAQNEHSEAFNDRSLIREARIAEILGLSEVKSSAYPGLDRSPKQNWVDKAGGLPNYIERIAKHVHYEHGKDISRAIAIAVGVVRRWCHGGSVSARGELRKGGAEKPVSGVSAKTKAKACAALAEWDAKRAKSKATTAAKGAARDAKKVSEAIALVEADGFHLLSVGQAEGLIEAVEWEAAGDGTVGFKEPSLAYCERVIREVEEAYTDWAEWSGGFSPEALRAIQEGELELDGATCGAYGLDTSLTESGFAVFDPVKHPRERTGKFADVLGKLGTSRPNTARVLSSIGRNARGRTKPLPTVETKHRGRHEIDRMIEKQGVEHGSDFPNSLDAVFRVPSATPWSSGLHASLPSAGQPDFSVDKAIGDVVSKFPNVKKWDMDGPKSDAKGEHYIVHVSTNSGEEHHIRVGTDGSVGLVEPKETKSVAAPKLYKMSDVEPTGESEKPYHMADHTLFAGHDGHLYEKLEHGTHLMTSKKGTKLAAVKILNHDTGQVKIAPAFATNHYYDIVKPKGLQEARVEKPFRGTHKFRPAAMDKASPTVLRGHAIEEGAFVRIVRGGPGQEKLDRAGKLAWIEDKEGNVQSVWKAGLVSRRDLLSEEVAPVRAKERLEETLALLESATSGSEVMRLRARRDVLAAQFARDIEERHFSSEERKALAAQGKALPNGSYPIENEEDLHNAATLAASGHGDVAAAEALIAKRAAALGVENPLKKAKEKA